jgi:DNA gyrase subunit B
VPTKKSTYDAKSIKVLEGVKAIRKRPGMYIGSTGISGLHHLIYEVVDNSVDEAMQGQCKKIDVTLNKDGSCTVVDDGRGIPIDPMKEHKNKPAVEIIMTKLHAGGKFDNRAYKVSGGLHGVGLSVVGALSKLTEVDITRDGKRYRQNFLKGEPQKPRITQNRGKSGTIIHFYPDPEIFEESTDFDYDMVKTRLETTAYLTKGIKINVQDEESGESASYHFKGGVADYVRHINERTGSLFRDIVYIEEEIKDVLVEVALQPTEGFQSAEPQCFANNILNPEGGSHLAGFKAALTKTINQYCKDQNFNKIGNFDGGDILEGLTAIISVKLSDPQYEGQTKIKLGNPNVKGIVQKAVGEGLKTWLEEHPAQGKNWMKKISSAKKAREAADKARKLVRKENSLLISGVAGKLAECQTTRPEEAEIFLVEGDSAGGSAKQARDRYFQAVLPLKGKILNVEKASTNKVLSNEEINSIIKTLGTGIGNIFDINGLRYHKVVIMTDADVDGAHICTLLLTLFFREFTELINRGHVYVACPPLYKVSMDGKKYYIQNDAELKKFTGKKTGRIQRYKGLGEMNPDELFETVMSREKRQLKQVEIEDYTLTDELFVTLMGTDVEGRKNWIQRHAKKVKNVDI